jgi:ribosomal protein S18 acetylase RimI-like enzyme
MTPAMPQLVQAITDELPNRFYCHYPKELEQMFASSYTVTPFGTYLKMDFHECLVDLSCIEPQDCIQLTSRDESQLRKLYQIAYPGNYFNPQMLATGKYYGVKNGEEILSVAGVHVYSRTYRIAVLGNVTTHPSIRNRGLAKQCVVTLLKTLEPDVDFIGLNVKADNYPALALYQRIGFSIASTYEEALFEKL